MGMGKRELRVTFAAHGQVMKTARRLLGVFLDPCVKKFGLGLRARTDPLPGLVLDHRLHLKINLKLYPARLGPTHGRDIPSVVPCAHTASAIFARRLLAMLITNRFEI